MTSWWRERWRKLFVREPLEQQAWPWAARGLRDLLIRTAEDDGLVARSRDRLRLALHVREGDELFDACVDELLDDQFLIENQSGLWVRNLPIAQGDDAGPIDRSAPVPPGDEEAPVPGESSEERRKRLARNRSRRRRATRDRVTTRDRQRDAGANASVTESVTERDAAAPSLPPLASPSSLPASQNNQPEETKAAAAHAHASVTERDANANSERDSNERDSVTERDAFVPCPEDLRLTDGQRRILESAMIPGWAIDALTVDFVSSATGSADDRRTLTVWRKCLSRAITGNWNDPTRRPKRDPASSPEARRPPPTRARTITGPILDGPPPELVPEPPSAPRRTREEQLRELAEAEEPEAAHA